VIERHHGTLRLADSGAGCRFELMLPGRAERRLAPRAALEA
jgi:hypothetical protein